MRFRPRVDRITDRVRRPFARVWTARWSTGRFGGVGITIGHCRFFLEQTEP